MCIPNALEAAGRDAGSKLMEIKRRSEKGHEIKILTEARFWRLAGGGARPRRKNSRRVRALRDYQTPERVKIVRAPCACR